MMNAAGGESQRNLAVSENVTILDDGGARKSCQPDGRGPDPTIGWAQNKAYTAL